VNAIDDPDSARPAVGPRHDLRGDDSARSIERHGCIIAVEVRFNTRVLTISELARRSGLATSALRFYERKELLWPATRAGRVRVYDDAAVDRVATVNMLQRAGFTLAEIARLTGPSGAPDDAWRAAIQAKIIELRRAREAIDQASVILEHALACPHPSIAACPVFLREVRAHALRMEHAGTGGPGEGGGHGR
jgi:DNA-binding transcriptional MerR regulator